METLERRVSVRVEEEAICGAEGDPEGGHADPQRVAMTQREAELSALRGSECERQASDDPESRVRTRGGQLCGELC